MGESQPENSLATRLKYVIVILIVGFMMPWLLTKSDFILQRWVEWEAVSRMKTLAAAIQKYKARTGHYTPVMRNVDQINRTLGTRLSDTDYLSLSCLNLYGNESECQVNTYFGWSLHCSNSHLDFAPHCVSVVFGIPCPTCDQYGCYQKKKKAGG